MTTGVTAATSHAIGITIGLLTSIFLRIVGFDRDRAVYPTILIVVALYYVLFAAMGGGSAMTSELIAMLGFAVVAVLGFRTNLWWAAAGLAGHGIFDIFHSRLITNPGVPEWWPAFCMSADVGLAAGVAVLLLQRRHRPRSHATQTGDAP